MEENLTTDADYDADYAAAYEKLDEMLDMNAYGGNQRNWAQDALANTWLEGISIDEWVKRALSRSGSNIRKL